MLEPVEFTQRRYRCPSCRRSWASKTRANRHVVDCHKDPEVRACSTCIHDHTPFPGDDELPAYCDIEARAEHEQIVRHCPSWEARRSA